MRLDPIIRWTAALSAISIFTGVRSDLGPLVVRLFDAGAGIGLFLLIGRASVRGRIAFLDKNAVYYLFATAYLYRCVSAVLLTNLGVAVKEAIQVTEFLVFVHLVAEATKTRVGRERFLHLLFMLSGGLCVLVVFWHISHGHYAGYKQLQGYSKLAFSLFALFAVAQYFRKGASSSTGWIVVGALVLTILSGERKGWVALAGSVGAMYMLNEDIRVRRILGILFRPRIIAAGALMVVMGVGLALQFDYVDRQFQTMYEVYVLLSNLSLQMDLSAFESSGSNLARIYILLFAIRTTLAHPILGVGTERWHEVLQQTSGTVDPRFSIGAHSEYQRFAVENGLTGLLIYMSGWVVTIRYAFRVFKESYAKDYHGLLLAGLCTYGAIINFFLAGGAPNILFWALPVGLILGIENDTSIKVSP